MLLREVSLSCEAGILYANLNKKYGEERKRKENPLMTIKTYFMVFEDKHISGGSNVQSFLLAASKEKSLEFPRVRKEKMEKREE